MLRRNLVHIMSDTIRSAGALSAQSLATRKTHVQTCSPEEHSLIMIMIRKPQKPHKQLYLEPVVSLSVVSYIFCNPPQP